jgi:hypothetical protein
LKEIGEREGELDSFVLFLGHFLDPRFVR